MNSFHPSGDPQQLETQNQLLRQENQQLREMNERVQRQLAEQQELAEQYQKSQSRFQAIFYQSSLGNKIIGPYLKVLQINAALQAILGYSEKEIVGTRITEYAHPQFVHHWQELQQHLWTKQIPSFQIETCLITKAGTILWCQVTSILFRDQDHRLGYTIVQDISQRKKLELQLQEIYDNQEAIMHMIAHDLKNPLHNIQLLNGFLQENLADLPVAEEQKTDSFKNLRMVARTSEQALAILEDLLVIGKLEATHNILTAIDLNSFIQSQLDYFSLNAHLKGIQVSFSHSPEPVLTLLHPPTFRRVLENLLSNAVKFTPPGGTITLALEKSADQVILQVSDTGMGIPEHLQVRIFDKFTKANRVGTEGETTTGLGMYIVKQIVQKHQGKIWVESQKNRGTRFFIQLNTP